MRRRAIVAGVAVIGIAVIGGIRITRRKEDETEYYVKGTRFRMGGRFEGEIIQVRPRDKNQYSVLVDGISGGPFPMDHQAMREMTILS